MSFTGTKQRVEFTSKHVHEVSTEPKINDVDQSEQSIWTTTVRKGLPWTRRSIIDFDVVSPPTSPNTEINLSPTPWDPFKQATTPDNANDPCESQPNSPGNQSPTHKGPPPTPSNAFKAGSPIKARSPVQQQEVQLYEGDFIEFLAEGKDTEFPDITPPPTKRQSKWFEKRTRGPTGENEETEGENKETKSKE